MKHFLSLLILLAASVNNTYASLNVLTCEPEWEALINELGGQHVTAKSATTAFQDPHFVEARPSLIAKARHADLLICTGAELEIGWLPLLLRQSGNANIQINELGYFLVSDFVSHIEKPKVLDRSHGDIHSQGNPHVHWGPYRVLTIAKALSQRLVKLDPEHADFYTLQLTKFTASWKSNIIRWKKTTSHLKDKKIIVHHTNWNYLLKWLGINIIGDLEPKPGLAPTSAHLAKLLKLTRNQHVDIILLANYQNKSGGKWLSQKAHTPLLQLPFTVTAHSDLKTLTQLYDYVISQLITTIK
jgi:zinc/manganese transport system substrate-binding protein